MRINVVQRVHEGSIVYESYKRIGSKVLRLKLKYMVEVEHSTIMAVGLKSYIADSKEQTRIDNLMSHAFEIEVPSIDLPNFVEWWDCERLAYKVEISSIILKRLTRSLDLDTMSITDLDILLSTLQKYDQYFEGDVK